MEISIDYQNETGLLVKKKLTLPPLAKLFLCREGLIFSVPLRREKEVRLERTAIAVREKNMFRWSFNQDTKPTLKEGDRRAKSKYEEKVYFSHPYTLIAKKKHLFLEIPISLVEDLCFVQFAHDDEECSGGGIVWGSLKEESVFDFLGKKCLAASSSLGDFLCLGAPDKLQIYGYNIFDKRPKLRVFTPSVEYRRFIAKYENIFQTPSSLFPLDRDCFLYFGPRFMGIFRTSTTPYSEIYQKARRYAQACDFYNSLPLLRKEVEALNLSHTDYHPVFFRIKQTQSVSFCFHKKTTAGHLIFFLIGDREIIGVACLLYHFKMIDVVVGGGGWLSKNQEYLLIKSPKSSCSDEKKDISLMSEEARTSEIKERMYLPYLMNKES